jgi:cation diffusion facilitator CzcD-associated flavoprotein CzcO
MRKILIVGMGACGLATSRLLSAQNLGEVVIVESIEEMKDVTKKNQFEREPITYVLNDLPKFEYTPSKREIESYHPFSKFIGKPKGRRGRR